MSHSLLKRPLRLLLLLCLLLIPAMADQNDARLDPLFERLQQAPDALASSIIERWADGLRLVTSLGALVVRLRRLLRDIDAEPHWLARGAAGDRPGRQPLQRRPGRPSGTLLVGHHERSQQA